MANDERSAPAAFDEMAFLKQQYPQLFALDDAALLKETKDALWALEVRLKALKDRGIPVHFWDPDKVIEEIDWINEEYGWDGVGR